jgi:hypothetical protein
VSEDEFLEPPVVREQDMRVRQRVPADPPIVVQQIRCSHQRSSRHRSERSDGKNGKAYPKSAAWCRSRIGDRRESVSIVVDVGCGPVVLVTDRLLKKAVNVPSVIGSPVTGFLVCSLVLLNGGSSTT